MIGKRKKCSVIAIVSEIIFACIITFSLLPFFGNFQSPYVSMIGVKAFC